MSASSERRDAGLRLISRINRWMVAGAVGLTGVISLVAEHSFRGRTVTAAGAIQRQPAAPSSSSSGSAGASAPSSDEGGLQQPAQAPAPAPVPSGSVGVVSGAS